MIKRSLVLTGMCLLLVGWSIAQNKLAPSLTANSPFDFIVNGTTFPKGEYVVRTTLDGRSLMIQNTTEPQYVTVVNNHDILLPSGATHTNTRMIFTLNNGQHVLHQICREGDDHTHDIVHGRDVIELVATQ